MGNEDAIRDAVQKELGDLYEVSVVKVVKNNGKEMTGITAKENGMEIAPVVYFDDAADPEKDAVRMADIIRRSQEAPENIAAGIADYENAKHNVCFKLVNTDRNKGMLGDVPHREFLNLSAVYYVRLDWPGDGEASVKVTDSLMSNWGVTEEELWERAFENTQRIYPADIETLESVIGAFFGKEEITPTGQGMIVVSNNAKKYGAGVIFYDGVLSELTERLGDRIFILPSSVHETIVLSDDGNLGAGALAEMVKSVNSTQVSEQEYLSDSVYRYEKGGEITIAE